MSYNFKVNDIHLSEVTETFDALTNQDLEEIFRSRHLFVDTTCPACLSEDVAYVFTHQTLDYKRCHHCETLYISPAPTEKQHLEYVVRSKAMAYWRENMPESMRKSRLPMYQERASYALDVFKRLGITPSSVLELGAGNGEFALELAQIHFIQSITLLEPQELKLNAPNIEIIPQGFDFFETNTRQFDAVFAWELIEHLLEPDQFLQIVRKALRPGAPLILSTPNEKSVETRTLKTASTNILFDHVRLYNPEAIEILLKRNGFKILELRTPGKLDTERLRNFYRANPEKLEDISHSFLLDEEPDPKRCEDFQRYLVDHKLSSHMRLVAVDATSSG